MRFPLVANVPYRKSKSIYVGAILGDGFFLVDTLDEEAAPELTAMGYENVRDYAGGKEDWMEAGFPAEGSRAKGKGSG